MLARQRRNLRGDFVQIVGIGQKNGDAFVQRALFDVVEGANSGIVPGVDAYAVDRVGRENDQAALLE